MRVAARGQNLAKSESPSRICSIVHMQSDVPYTPKEKGSQGKNNLYIVSFWWLTLYMVCLPRGFPGL